MAFVAGWEAAIRQRTGRWLAAALVVFGIGLAAWGVLIGHSLPKWPLAITALFAVALAAVDFGQQRLSRSTQHATRTLFFLLPFAALPLLALYALFGAIVPQLIR